MTDSLLGSSWWRNKRQQATASQTEISMSTQPAEIEVSHVNWSLWEQDRSIPRRPTEKPPATMGSEYYSRHHRNTQQTIYCVLLLLTGGCELFVRYMVEMGKMEVQSCTVTSSLRLFQVLWPHWSHCMNKSSSMVLFILFVCLFFDTDRVLQHGDIT